MPKSLEEWIVLGGLATFTIWLFVILPLAYWQVPPV